MTVSAHNTEGPPPADEHWQGEMLWQYVERMRERDERDPDGLTTAEEIAGLVATARAIRATAPPPASVSAAELQDTAAALRATIAEDVRSRRSARLAELFHRLRGVLRPRRAFAMTALGAAAAALGLLALRHVHRPSTSDLTLAWVVQDHLKFVAEGPQFVSTDPGRVAAWLTRQLQMPVRPVSSVPPGWALLGGRRCHLAERPVAVQFLERAGRRVSVLQVHRYAGQLPVLQRRQVGELTYEVGQEQGVSVVFYRSGSEVLVLVGAVPKEQLLELAGAVRQ
ncbi:MAG: hypothetical protein COZ06_31170 [Armatimonadetes bacterium CG_4_10_14_3_um_filter_66_18]|nr:hypothetical protein [Armatimonadota bacterium]OIP10236.1 MAG: hypothetical protein AUJ96_04175 [Armatimonadetes bacterium CG2_30_66_41]PIU94016.1 MAG: hypothetical protein COS65_09810 [Armatimonadetes bacterium CG06_land_8_20_14_3_00_66_21]PIX43228.1 MAG: hypothetical protein COZ57_19575 [Armatimonadetes bacterium CG_4_8_14_3_um_filter_66_20]PIY38462.1 MAG: hypothetical protein COZ06_31170 [Armatimonadetes bacterium CG_4_10_14_3_um_filter_66_18]PIZ36415.1 MAG: hypothetical protein COY42_25